MRLAIRLAYATRLCACPTVLAYAPCVCALSMTLAFPRRLTFP
jgi:hypothetical protein